MIYPPLPPLPFKNPLERMGRESYMMYKNVGVCVHVCEFRKLKKDGVYAKKN